METVEPCTVVGFKLKQTRKLTMKGTHLRFGLAGCPDGDDLGPK